MSDRVQAFRARNAQEQLTAIWRIIFLRPYTNLPQPDLVTIYIPRNVQEQFEAVWLILFLYVPSENLIERQHPGRQEELGWKMASYIQKFERLRIETQWMDDRLSIRWLRLHWAAYMILHRLRKDALPEYFSEAAPPYAEVRFEVDDGR